MDGLKEPAFLPAQLPQFVDTSRPFNGKKRGRGAKYKEREGWLSTLVAVKVNIQVAKLSPTLVGLLLGPPPKPACKGCKAT